MKESYYSSYRRRLVKDENLMKIGLTNMVLRKDAKAFDLSIEPGKISGVIGLEQNGQEEFLQVLCGLRAPISGELTGITDVGSIAGFKNMHEAFEYGIAYIPRDRKNEGILPALSVLDNFSLATLRQFSKLGFIDSRKIREAYKLIATELGIVAASPRISIRTLSGGNQQKVLLARWIAAKPKVLLLNDPSRGVDHPTKVALYSLYRKLADNGTTVVLRSSEIEELMIVADTTIVFRDGTVQDIVRKKDATRERILGSMFGVSNV